MRHLGLALFREGPTDQRFLNPLLRRCVEDICLNKSDESIEVGDVLELRSPERVINKNRETMILQAAKDAIGAYDILFLHTDGQGDPIAARRERIEPAERRITEELSSMAGRTVAVVPVRETEAWAMADGEAIRQTFGTHLSDIDIGVPSRPRGVESIPDPKSALNQAYRTVIGRRKRRRSPVYLLETLGERTSLSKLRQVPAFQRFETELLDILGALRIIRIIDE